MIPGGYMYIVDGQQRGSVQGFGGHFHHGFPSHNFSNQDGQPRFFPVAANMPVGDDSDR